MVDDVQWFRLEDPSLSRSTWISVDRPVYVALTLPDGSISRTDPVALRGDRPHHAGDADQARAGALAVLTTEVRYAAGGWLAAECGVAAVVIVGV